jgi:hypothetical protein
MFIRFILGMYVKDRDSEKDAPTATEYPKLQVLLPREIAELTEKQMNYSFGV